MRTTLTLTAAVLAVALTGTAEAGPPHGRDGRGHHDRIDHRYDHYDRYDRYGHTRGYAKGPRHRDSRHDRAESQARRYAATAVRQAREARRLGFRPDHPRWSLNFQRHFRWALRADPYKLERETRKRARVLRDLRRYAARWHARPYPY